MTAHSSTMLAWLPSASALFCKGDHGWTPVDTQDGSPVRRYTGVSIDTGQTPDRFWCSAGLWVRIERRGVSGSHITPGACHHPGLAPPPPPLTCVLFT